MLHSRLILGSFLLYLANMLHRDLKEAIERVLRSLREVPERMVKRAVKSITETVEEMFWEVRIH